MNTTITENKKKLYKDFYEDYYPSSRIEKAIFNYLDQDYYTSEDGVFFTIYKKENDWFVNKSDIEDEIKSMFGLTLPDRIKVGQDDYIEPARNPIPKRVIQNWVNGHLELKAHKEAMIHDKKKNSLERRKGRSVEEDLENWGFDGKEIGLTSEQVDPEDYGIIDGEKKDDGAERLYKQHAHDNEDYVDTTPFTKKEVLILKTLHKNLTKQELSNISVNTPEAYGGTDKKFWNVMKLFGIEETNTEQNTRESRYARWAYDNWTEDGDYGKIETPIKVQLKWYEIDREESGSQVEYKIGDAEVLGFDEDNAGDRADYDFYAWGGEMETNDYGDYESYDSEITRTDFIRMAEQYEEQEELTKDEKEDEIDRLETEIEIDMESIKNMEKELKRADKKDIAVFGKTKRFGYEDDDDDKPAVIGIGRNSGLPSDQGGQVSEQEKQQTPNQGPKLDFPEWDPQFKLSDKSEKITKDIEKTQIELKKTDVEQKKKQLKDLKTQQTKNTDDDSTSAMGDSKPAMGGEKDSGMIKISGIEDVNEQEDINEEKVLNESVAAVQTALTGLGFFFPPADGINAILSFIRKDWVGGILNLIAIIPGPGDLAKVVLGPLFKIIPAATIFKIISKGDDAALEVINAGRKNPKILTKVLKWIKSGKDEIISFIDPLINALKDLPDLVKKVMPTDWPPKLIDNLTNLKKFFVKLANTNLEDILASAAVAVGTGQVEEQIDPELKYAIDQQYRTNPEIRNSILQSLEGDESGKYYLNPDGAELNVPPIKIAQKFSDVNGYGDIKFDMQGGNGVAYFTDKDLVIKLTTDESEYFTANKLVGEDNDYIVKVFESAKIKTSHTKDYDLFVVVLEALPMTEDMEQRWSDCCCGEESPILIDYLEEPTLVLPPVANYDKCQPIYDNIVGIQKNFVEYGIVWSDIGIDNMGIKEDGKLAVIDLGETRGGTNKGVEVTLNLESVKIRPLTKKQIKKQLILI